ncbi:phosphate-starvation-inducible PsiE family protein [Microcoleus sp. S36a_D3]|uniref:phosphate-starvation-inducible PsiE family protein n=1 Tax=unclassified Microcoleus TaxID=2642155 RepID=UPI003FA5C4DD
MHLPGCRELGVGARAISCPLGRDGGRSGYINPPQHGTEFDRWQFNAHDITGMLKKIFRRISQFDSEKNFLHFTESVEVIISKILSLAMIVVIIVSVCDLLIYLAKELFNNDNPLLKDTLFVIFGLFLNVLIALEILENITAYLKKHVIQVELVIVTSLIAVSRKIIILDLEKKTAADLIGLSTAILALSISYLIVRYSNNRHDT